jgi:MFS transporter, PAT family, beta-lactamase induction signal transducer AmpG
MNELTNNVSARALADTTNGVPAEKPTWRESLRVYLEPASLRMFALGFSAGLPLLLVFGTLSIPFLTSALGRRRSWLIVAQIGVMIGLVGMAFSDPKQSVSGIVWFALMVAFFSATQDIALDAFRIESGDKERQSALSATYQMGYRIAMIWAGAGVLWIAARAEVANPQNYDVNAWKVAYFVMAASMFIGFITVLFTKEPAPQAFKPAKNIGEWLETALIEPFADFFRRYGWYAALILALIATYRISDIVMGIMANPFYVDMGYTKDEVAAITKLYGVIMTLVGAFIGGVLSMKFGLMRTLMLGAVLSAASNLLFAWLTTRGHDVNALTVVISIDNLSSGIASTAFIAYMSSLTNISYSATQYALLSSMMLLLPKWIAGFSGVAVNAIGYSSFFMSTALLGVPVLILIFIASRRLK